MVEKRPALGKGLSALIPDAPEPARPGTLEVDVDLLEPNRFQPRTHVDPAGIDELARSIKVNGLVQPILVRREGARYQIIAGERRWRAAQQAGLLKVPVVVKDIPADDGRLLEWALIENIQREDLNPIEQALAYRRMVDEFGRTQDEIAEAVGKDRSSVANILRLLRLPAEVRAQVAAGALSMGHARALLSLDQDGAIKRAAAEVVDRGLSVRETETLVKKLLAGPPPAARPRVVDPNTREAESQLRLALGVPVRILRKKKGGSIEIAFSSEDELQRIYEAITEK